MYIICIIPYSRYTFLPNSHLFSHNFTPFYSVVPYKTNPNPEPNPEPTPNPTTDPASDPGSYQDPNPTLIPDMTEIDEEALLAGDNTDNYDENFEFNMNDSLGIDELCLYDMEDQTTNEHEQNTGSPDTDKQHINEPSIEQNTTEQTMDRHNTDEIDMDITEEADNNDTNSHQNSSTNQHSSHNKDNMHNHTHNSIDFIDVPNHLLTSFKIIYGLKIRHNKLLTNLENLQEHRKTNTLPPGLTIHHKSKYYMDKTFKDRWENILTNASLDLLDTTIDYHKHCIQDTQYKLQHRIDELKKRCDDDTAQKLINKTDTLNMKYTERSLLALNKTTKRLKRLENTSTKKHKQQTIGLKSNILKLKARTRKQDSTIHTHTIQQIHLTQYKQYTQLMHTHHIHHKLPSTATYKTICIHGHITLLTAL